MLKMSAFSFDARRESLAEARNRFSDRFMRKIVPDGLHSRFRIPWFLFQLTKTYQNYLLLFCIARKQNIMS